MKEREMERGKREKWEGENSEIQLKTSDGFMNQLALYSYVAYGV